MTFEDIKYIFQIPLSWYKWVERRLRNAYGENFIRVEDGDYGGMQIGIDQVAFENAVSAVVGDIDLSGTVKSVDGILPDANGDVHLGLSALPRTVDGIPPDANGNIDLSALTVNDIGLSNGVAPTIHSHGEITYDGKINGCSQDCFVICEDGAITHSDSMLTATSGCDSDVDTLKAIVSAATWTNGTPTFPGSGSVNSVDGVGPDQQGNVPLNAVRTIDGQQPQNGNINLTAYVKTVNNIGPDANGNVDVDVDLSGVVYQVDGVSPNSQGNVVLNAVKRVANQSPDNNGNVDLTGFVKSVNGEQPDLNGDVDLGDIVNSVNNIAPDAYGNVDLTGLVYSVEGNLPDQTGDVSIPGMVYSVDNITADSNGNVSLTGIVRTVDNTQPDAQGNVDLTGIVKSVENELPDANGNVTLSGVVKTTGPQDVDGIKTFKSRPIFEQGVDIRSDFIIRNVNTSIGREVSFSGLLTIGSQNLIAFMPDASDSSSVIVVFGGHNQEKNIYRLDSEPDGTVDNAIATVKFVKDNSISSVNNISPTDGNVDIVLNQANRPVVTDANKKLTTIAPVSDQNIDVITGVTWTGTQLQFTRKRIAVTSGIITSVTTLANTNINTTTYTGS